MQADRMLADRRIWIMAAYGFVAGLPLPLSGFTFRLWLSEGGVSLAMIGLTANIGLSYTLKFLWAPILDQTAPAGPLRRFGQRRGWLLAIQPLLVVSATLLALSNPAAAPGAAIAAAALVGFLSASQDIAIDAWRIETFEDRMQGAALAAYVWGYRGALLVSGSGVIASAGIVGWNVALAGVAALIAVGVVVTLLAPEPDVPRQAQAGSRGSLVARVRHAVVEPLTEFLSRPGAFMILAFVALFKLDEAMAGVMTAPFYRSLGFDRAAIAVANFIPSLAAVLAGTAVGGWLVARLGVGRALLVTGCVQSSVMGMYVVLAYSPGQVSVLYATVFIESFAGGLADAAFIAYLSGLCSVAFTATQYALLSSVAAIGLRTIGGFTGFLAEAVGFKIFYMICTLAAWPSMGIMIWLLRRYPPVEKKGEGDDPEPARSLAR
ncbi:MAG: MFS transporter [Acetobacteraceae bacterium]